jgi:hypothetical protein
LRVFYSAKCTTSDVSVLPHTLVYYLIRERMRYTWLRVFYSAKCTNSDVSVLPHTLVYYLIRERMRYMVESVLMRY